MDSKKNRTAIIRIHCPDQRGLVARVTDFIHRNNGNIIALDQHTDNEQSYFFMRLEFEINGFGLTQEQISPAFEHAIAIPCKMNWSIEFNQDVHRMAIFVRPVVRTVDADHMLVVIVIQVARRERDRRNAKTVVLIGVLARMHLPGLEAETLPIVDRLCRLLAHALGFVR